MVDRRGTTEAILGRERGKGRVEEREGRENNVGRRL